MLYLFEFITLLLTVLACMNVLVVELLSLLAKCVASELLIHNLKYNPPRKCTYAMDI
ncbi:hypothetical protein BH18THE2_BH18THE2_35010 [soil metagenome]